jgi:diaminopimelate decarboxylase
VFDYAKEQGVVLTLLDIGGGFPGTVIFGVLLFVFSICEKKGRWRIAFRRNRKDVLGVARRAVSQKFWRFAICEFHCFSPFSFLFFSLVRIIGEPGRYFCSGSSTLAVVVNSKRKKKLVPPPSAPGLHN